MVCEHEYMNMPPPPPPPIIVLATALPVTVSAQTENGFHEIQQLPLRLAWALTIHKSQGLTLPKAWIDIGKSGRTAGVSYVALSRVKNIVSCVIRQI